MHTHTPPEQVFGVLFSDLHASGLWPDGKTIADAIPLKSPEEIMAAYAAQKNTIGFNIKTFFHQFFRENPSRSTTFKSNTERSINEHIELLWEVLTRKKDPLVEGSSLLPLPYPYIVPGGRFNEIYYWDSYFTQLGLLCSNRTDLIENMVNNFAHLIDRIGYIPNGNRTYFLGRSQPPYFSQMVKLLAEATEEKRIGKYFSQLEKEYQFWMEGAEKTSAKNRSEAHCVFSPQGTLNRYFDKYCQPRAEMYQTDLEIAKTSTRNTNELFSNLRSACESGWDFSSRWLRQADALDSIIATQIVPVDLNCLLYDLEKTLAKAASINNIPEKEMHYQRLAEQRKQIIQTSFWNAKTGFFHDLYVNNLSPTPSITLAGIYPMAYGLASESQAKACAKKIADDFLKDGGVITSLQNTSQQWDAPNGWAPLQWMTYKGLKNYGFDTLANDIASRWINLTTQVYKRTGKMLEKYNVVDTSLLSGGGEYAVQDGFGWTNGVVLAFIHALNSSKKM